MKKLQDSKSIKLRTWAFVQKNHIYIQLNKINQRFDSSTSWRVKKIQISLSEKDILRQFNAILVAN